MTLIRDNFEQKSHLNASNKIYLCNTNVQKLPNIITCKIFSYNVLCIKPNFV